MTHECANGRDPPGLPPPPAAALSQGDTMRPEHPRFTKLASQGACDLVAASVCLSLAVVKAR